MVALVSCVYAWNALCVRPYVCTRVHAWYAYACVRVWSIVQVLDASTGETVRVIGAGVAGNAAGQLNSPRGLVLQKGRQEAARPVLHPSAPTTHSSHLASPSPGPDPRRSLLYVAEEKNHRVQVFDAATGEHVRFFGTGEAGSAAGQLNSPFALALLEAAEAPVLFVSEPYNCRVTLLNAETGQHIAFIGSKGAGPSQLNSPYELAVLEACADDSRSSWRPPLVFVSDRGSHRIQVFNVLTGEHVRSIGTQGSGAG